jgi:Protein of unknown function (DUF2631)
MSAVTGAHSVSKQANAVHGTHEHEQADAHYDAAESLHDRPEDWGWHGETGKWGRAGAWFATIFLVLFMFGNEPLIGPGHVAVLIFAGLMVIILLWDRQRRKNAWRAR